jgi:hypothetical protein
MIFSPHPTLRMVAYFLVSSRMTAWLQLTYLDIGILSALLQGRYVRPSLARIGELQIASLGIASCSVGLSLLALLPLHFIRNSPAMSTTVLYAAATALAYTSATVVTGLTASAASCCDEGNEALKRGRALGGFRSKVSPAVGFTLPKLNLFKGTTWKGDRTDISIVDILAYGSNNLLLSFSSLSGRSICCDG